MRRVASPVPHDGIARRMRPSSRGSTACAGSSSMCTSSTAAAPSRSGRRPKVSGSRAIRSSRSRSGRWAISSTAMCKPGSSCASCPITTFWQRGRGVGAPVLGSATAVGARWQSVHMPDDSELADINPYDLMESEAARLEFYFGSLRGDDWNEPSACEGWSVKDVLAHLAGGEEYNRACLGRQRRPDVRALRGSRCDRRAFVQRIGRRGPEGSHAGRAARRVPARERRDALPAAPP